MSAIAAWRNPHVYQMTMGCVLVGKCVIAIAWKLAPVCEIVVHKSSQFVAFALVYVKAQV